MSTSWKGHRVFLHTLNDEHYFHCVFCNESVKLVTYPADKKYFVEHYFDDKCGYNGKKGAISRSKALSLFKQSIGGTLSNEDEGES